MLVNSIQDIKFEAPLVGRIHIGRVMDNVDPKGLQRLRVAIPRLTEGIATEDLPWYSVKQPVGLGGARTSAFSIPEVGTTVTVVFYTENIYTGIVDGILITEENNQTNQALVNTQPDVPADFPKYARNTKAEKNNQTAKGFVNEHYPHSYGFVDSTGNWSRVDKLNNSIEYVHSSKSSFHIDRDGNVTIHITGNLTLVVDKDIQQTCINNVSANTGNLFSRTDGSHATYIGQNRSTETCGSSTELVDGTKTREIHGDSVESVGANKLTVVSGNFHESVKGHKSSATKGSVNVVANTINLN